MARYCTACGKELPEGEAFCTECGTKVPENTEAPKTEAAQPKETPTASSAVATEAAAAAPPPVQPQLPPLTSNQTVPPQPNQAPESPIVGTGTFFGLQFLFGIPVIGWLICIVMAFAPKNKNIKHYARAMLIWLLIGLVISLLLFALLFWLGNLVVNTYSETINDVSGLVEQIGGIGELAEQFGDIGELAEQFGGMDGLMEQIGGLSESGDLGEILEQLPPDFFETMPTE